ncbi:MAG TPA: AMP-binding protein, partial [Dehalococcoidia bacterium]|nr:AMP-binding protein [Dehalococcoidia bacterium]
MTSESKQTIEALLEEARTFPAPPEFARRAHVSDPSIYDKARQDPLAFWEGVARELVWFQPWQKTLEWDPPWAKWFVGGKTNLAYNCLDRHLSTARKNKAAIVWEGEPGDRAVLTYWDLCREVNKFANALKSLGVQKGDRVTIYLPMIPELPIAMLACARIGAPHSVVFGGFSAESLRDRIKDAQSKLLITADGGFRRGEVVPLKKNVDEACETLATTPNKVRNVLVLQRTGGRVDWRPGRDVWWHDAMDDASDDCPCEPMDSEDMLFLLYTSGSTGKPKGILHTTGGYLTFTNLTARLTFNLIPDNGQVFWCTADVGWVTGHSYVIYG